MENMLTTVGFKVKSLDELKGNVPAAFSPKQDPNRSDKYSFVPTHELLALFAKLGWAPYSGKQNGKSPFARHIVRLENPEFPFMDLKNDKVKPQIILDNSHNGSSSAKVHMGLFRLVCTNGLVVAMPGLYSGVKFRHIGLSFEEVKDLVEETMTHYNVVGEHIGDMAARILTPDEQLGFAVSAYAHRVGARLFDEDGEVLIEKVLKEMNPDNVIMPLRDADNGDDLWTKFNVIQERMVKGEFDKFATSGRKSHPRQLLNGVRNIEYNKVLWEVAEDYLDN
jgi:hypothetical protein